MIFNKDARIDSIKKIYVALFVVKKLPVLFKGNTSAKNKKITIKSFFIIFQAPALFFRLMYILALKGKMQSK